MRFIIICSEYNLVCSRNAKNQIPPYIDICSLARFLLVVAAFIAIELKGRYNKGSEPRELCKTIHSLLGRLIFILMIFRLGARLIFGVPAPPSRRPAFVTLAKAMRWSMYVLLFIPPILGVIFLQAGGTEVDFFGWV